MKGFLGLFIFAAAAVSQISCAKLNVTVFYETLCPDSIEFFAYQMWPAYKDPAIHENIYVELVPFGHATFTENPFRISCQHGSRECQGNVLNACFLARYPNNYDQVRFISCVMSTNDPPRAGEMCARQYGYSYEGINECASGVEGQQLQIKNGRRTLNFYPRITFIPTIVYDNVYSSTDQRDSLYRFKEVVLRKLRSKGVAV